MEEVETFEKTDAGSSHTQPIQAGTLHKGDYVMLKDHPCRLTEISTAKTGKHGHAKATIVGVDIFTKNKYEDSCPTSHSIEQPIVGRKEYQLTDVSHDGDVSLLDEDNKLKEDLTLKDDDEDDKKLRIKFEELLASGKTVMVGVISAMGQEKIIDFKEMAS